MLWMQWIWSHGHGLSTQNTSFQNSSDTLQGTQRSPCQIKFEAPTWRSRQMHPIQRPEGHSPTTEDITAWVFTIHIEAALDHNTEIDAATTEVAHDNLTQPAGDTATDLTVTHYTGHIEDHPRITALWVIDHSRSHSQPSYQSSRHESYRSESYSSRMRRRPHPKKNTKVKIEDLHTDYYSSHDHSSDSGEESDLLN